MNAHDWHCYNIVDILSFRYVVTVTVAVSLKTWYSAITRRLYMLSYIPSVHIIESKPYLCLWNVPFFRNEGSAWNSYISRRYPYGQMTQLGPTSSSIKYINPWPSSHCWWTSRNVLHHYVKLVITKSFSTQVVLEFVPNRALAV